MGGLIATFVPGLVFMCGVMFINTNDWRFIGAGVASMIAAHLYFEIQHDKWKARVAEKMKERKI